MEGGLFVFSSGLVGMKFPWVYCFTTIRCVPKCQRQYLFQLIYFEIYIENDNFVKDFQVYSHIPQSIFCIFADANTTRDHVSQLKTQLISRGTKVDRTVTGEGLWRAMDQNTKGLVLALQ